MVTETKSVDDSHQAQTSESSIVINQNNKGLFLVIEQLFKGNEKAIQFLSSEVNKKVDPLSAACLALGKSVIQRKIKFICSFDYEDQHGKKRINLYMCYGASIPKEAAHFCKGEGGIQKVIHENFEMTAEEIINSSDATPLTKFVLKKFLGN